MATATKKTTAKKPAPRKSAAKKTPARATAKTITVDGLELAIDPDVFDDFELLDMMASLQEDADALQLPKMVRKIYGDHYQAVLGHLRDPHTGRVPTERVSSFVTATMEAVAPKSA